MKPPYGRSKRRADLLRGAQLGVRVRTAEAGRPVDTKLTPTRRSCLQAIDLGKVRWFPSSGWKANGVAVNAVVRDCVRAGWAAESLDGDRRTIALTDLGRAALGTEESA